MNEYGYVVRAVEPSTDDPFDLCITNDEEVGDAVVVLLEPKSRYDHWIRADAIRTEADLIAFKKLIKKYKESGATKNN